MTPTHDDLIKLAADAEALVALLEAGAEGSETDRTSAVARAGLNSHALFVRCSKVLVECEPPGGLEA